MNLIGYVPFLQVIPAGETDDKKLIDMILETKKQVKEQGMNEIVQTFILTAEYSHRCKMAGPSHHTITESEEPSQ